jgi:plastocyanin
MRFFRVVASLATVTILLLVACGGTSTVPAQPAPTATAQPSPTPLLTPVAAANVKIVVKNGQNTFDPAMLTVKVGTQVVWTNDTNVPHTVTSDTGVFDTPPDYLLPHQTFKVIFTKPGTYTYYCNFHLYMKGAIIVIT